jgi:hypothetical protein
MNAFCKVARSVAVPLIVAASVRAGASESRRAPGLEGLAGASAYARTGFPGHRRSDPPVPIRRVWAGYTTRKGIVVARRRKRRGK